MNILTNVTVGFEIPGENKKVQNCLLTFVNKESNKDAALTSRDDTCGLRTTPLAHVYTGDFQDARYQPRKNCFNASLRLRVT